MNADTALLKQVKAGNRNAWEKWIAYEYAEKLNKTTPTQKTDFIQSLQKLLQESTSSLVLEELWSPRRSLLGGIDIEEAYLALPKIEDALAANPENAMALVLHGDIYRRGIEFHYRFNNGAGSMKELEDLPKAIECYDKAIKLGSKTAMERRATMYLDAYSSRSGRDKKNLDAAIKLFEDSGYDQSDINKLKMSIHLEHSNFNLNLKLFKIKAGEMVSKTTKGNLHYKKPSEDASHLFERLSLTSKKLLDGTIDLDTFKEVCLEQIELYRPELEKHRGFKKVLADLVSIIVSIATLGVANLVTGRYTLFKVQTDSAKKLDELVENVQNTGSMDSNPATPKL